MKTNLENKKIKSNPEPPMNRLTSYMKRKFDKTNTNGGIAK